MLNQSSCGHDHSGGNSRQASEQSDHNLLAKWEEALNHPPSEASGEMSSLLDEYDQKTRAKLKLVNPRLLPPPEARELSDEHRFLLRRMNKPGVQRVLDAFGSFEDLVTATTIDNAFSAILPAMTNSLGIAARTNDGSEYANTLDACIDACAKGVMAFEGGDPEGAVLNYHLAMQRIGELPIELPPESVIKLRAIFRENNDRHNKLLAERAKLPTYQHDADSIDYAYSSMGLQIKMILAPFTRDIDTRDIREFSFEYDPSRVPKKDPIKKILGESGIKLTKDQIWVVNGNGILIGKEGEWLSIYFNETPNLRGFAMLISRETGEFGFELGGCRDQSRTFAGWRARREHASRAQRANNSLFGKTKRAPCGIWRATFKSDDGAITKFMVGSNQ